jgi:tetratricopeptide (TPR) repeat protein
MTDGTMSTASSKQDASIHAQRERAFALHERGELSAAQYVYRDVLQRSPHDLEVMHALGVLALQTSQYAYALEVLMPLVRAHPSAAAHGDLGNALCGLSRFDEAIRRYDDAIALEPGYAPAHVNRGHALRTLGRLVEALGSYDRAIASWADFFEAHFGRADVLRDLGRPADALASYDKAATLRPAVASIYVGRSTMLVRLNRWDDALANIDRAFALGVCSAEAHTIRGLCLVGLQRPDEALESYHQALSLQPQYVAAHVNRGILLRALERFEEALHSCDAAIAIRSDSFEAIANRALVLADLDRLEEALAACDAVIAMRPDHADLHLNRAATLVRLERFDAALAAYDVAICLRPDYAQAHSSRAGALQRTQRYVEALASCDQAIALTPALADAHLNRGLSLRELKRTEEALESLTAACALEPDRAVAQFNLGCLWLQRGRYDRGWDLYEWRNKTREVPAFRRFLQPQWRGQEDLSGKTLFLYADQGLGDTIQFSRYATIAESRGARVVLSAQNGLRRLLSRLGPTIEILEESAAPPAFDYHSPLASLPGAFKTLVDTIPAAVPYLSAEPERVASWRQKLRAHGFKIGICWQGSTQGTGMERSFPLRALHRLGTVPSVRLISLQKVDGTGQLVGLPSSMVVETLGEHTFDAGPDALIDTAAVMESLDLIITCDTSIAHLAGALGRPAWIALKYVPDWRWMLDRDDSPWYPTLRLFRQSRIGDWHGVFDRMYDALAAVTPRN